MSGDYDNCGILNKFKHVSSKMYVIEILDLCGEECDYEYCKCGYECYLGVSNCCQYLELYLRSKTFGNLVNKNI